MSSDDAAKTNDAFQDQTLLDPQSEKIAFAWWNARQRRKRRRNNDGDNWNQEGLNRIPYDQNVPVDVDDVFLGIDTSLNIGITNTNTDDNLTITSGTPSEKTPVMSNRKYYSTNTYAESVDGGNSSNSCGVLQGIREVPSSNNTEESEESIVADTTHGFWDYRTTSGRMAILLVIIFVTALAAVTTSSLHFNNNNNRTTVNTNNNNNNGGTNLPPIPPTPAPFSITTTTTLTPTSTTSLTTTTTTASSPPPSVSVVVLDEVPPLLPTDTPTSSPGDLVGGETTTTPTNVPTSSGGQLEGGLVTPAPTMTTPRTQSPTESSSPTKRPTNTPTSLSTPTELPTSAPTLKLQDMLLQEQATVFGNQPNEGFGQALALSADGQTLVVGAPQAPTNDEIIRAGRVAIYKKMPPDDEWTLVQVIPGTKEQNSLGSAVAVTANGAFVVTAEPTDGTAGEDAGRVQVYEFDGSRYLPKGPTLLGPGPTSYFGVSVAIDGNRLAVGAPYHSRSPFRFQGVVTIYEWNGQEWAWIGAVYGEANLDWLGSAVDLKGDILVASAPRNFKNFGYVRAWRYHQDTATWSVLGDDMVNSVHPPSTTDRFGDSLSLTYAGIRPRIAVGVPRKASGRSRFAGMVQVYELEIDGQRWRQLGDSLYADRPQENEEFGAAVSLHGGLLAVGVPGAGDGAGAVKLYRYADDGSSLSFWEAYETLDFVGSDRDSDFGVALAVARPSSSRLTMAVGAVAANSNLLGSVRVYTQSPGAIAQSARLGGKGGRQ